MKWSKTLENKLIALYPNTPNYELMEIFNVSEKTLTSKAYRLGLLKSKECISYLIGRRNKIVGRDLTDELLKKLALNYKTRGEFQKKDSSAYASARRKGILNDICEHMVSKSFSIPQLTLKKILDSIIPFSSIYNDRKSLKPFEIDISYPEQKLGFEYNGKGWHINNDRDTKKHILSKSTGINLITLIENSRNYEEDIKKQLISNLSKINEILKLNISEANINEVNIGNIYNQVYNKTDLFEIAKKYTLKKDFRLNDSSVYVKLYKMNLLSEATKHMLKK